MRCGFLETRHCRAEWVKFIVGRAEAPQACLNAGCGESVGYCFAFQHSHPVAACSTAPGIAMLDSEGIRCPYQTPPDAF